MIAALRGKQFQAPFMFEGHCDTKTFELYIEEILIPTLKQKTTVIIDNASFHKSEKIKNLISAAGCNLIFLPPYSPDLNPIEKYWHKLKTIIRKIMRDAKDCLENAMISALKNQSTC